MKSLQSPFLRLIYILLFSSSLHGNNIFNNTSDPIKPDDSLYYKNAIYNFKEQHYKISLEMFDTLKNIYPNNENILFYYGRTAFELEKYDQALKTFQQILEKNNKHHRARLEYARTLYMLKEFKKAEIEFQTVLADKDTPQNVKENINKFLGSIKEQSKKVITNTIVMLGFGWSDNIDNNPYEDLIYIYDFPVSNDTDRKKDFNANLTLIENIIVPTSKDKKHNIETSILLYTQKQKQYDENDMNYFTILSGYSYTGKNFKEYFSLLYDHAWFGGDPLLQSYGFQNDFIYNIFSDHILSTKIQYKKKHFFDDKAKDHIYKQFTLSYKIPTNHQDYLQVNTEFANQKKDDGERVDISKDIHSYKISYNKNIYTSYDMLFSYLYEKHQYKEQSFDLPKRHDTEKNYALKLSKKLNHTDVIFTEINHADIKSNINTYSYRKNSLSVYYKMLF